MDRELVAFDVFAFRCRVDECLGNRSGFGFVDALADNFA